MLGTAAVGFGALAVVVGYTGFKLGQVERLEVAGALSAPVARPVTAADVLRDPATGGPANGDAAGDAAGAADGGGDGDTEGAASSDPADSPTDISGATTHGGPSGDATGLRDTTRVRNSVDELIDYSDGLVGALNGDFAQNFLIVGTDSIDGIDEDDPLLEGRYGTHLADVIMVLRLRPDRTAALVSVPRDLLVTIAGTSTQAKINSAYNLRSDTTSAQRAARLIDTIEAELDIGLSHYVEVDLDGFRKLADALGGVEMTFEHALRDTHSGFFTDPGTQVLNGDQSLAYVRARQLEFLDEDGRWRSYGGRGSDLARNARQRTFGIIAARQLAAQASDLTKVRSWLDVAAGNVATSDTINIVTDGLDLAREFAAIDFDRDVEQYSLDVRDSREQGPVPWSLSVLANEHNRRVLDVFRGIGYHDVVERRVRVEVAGPRANRVGAQLRALEFEVANAQRSTEATTAAVNAATSGSVHRSRRRLC